MRIRQRRRREAWCFCRIKTHIDAYACMRRGCGRSTRSTSSPLPQGFFFPFLLAIARRRVAVLALRTHAVVSLHARSCRRVAVLQSRAHSRLTALNNIIVVAAAAAAANDQMVQRTSRPRLSATRRPVERPSTRAYTCSSIIVRFPTSHTSSEY